ncbi:MAG: hypothetical protein JWQ95_4334 [Sphaerisporangium sp.]|nr:hypothetical protein [Sphaerisporangium sp.]
MKVATFAQVRGQFSGLCGMKPTRRTPKGLGLIRDPLTLRSVPTNLRLDPVESVLVGTELLQVLSLRIEDVPPEGALPPGPDKVIRLVSRAIPDTHALRRT